MTSHPYQIPPYPYKLCQKALWCVFDTLEFKNQKTAWLLRKSYFSNLKNMLKYADENNIDELEYILDIRNILLKSNYAHEL